jgi:hypothetical protein
MQTPNANTPVSRLVASVRFLLAALAQLVTTRDLVPTLQGSFDAFLAAVTATVAAGDATIQPRVAVRFAERELEVGIRALFLAAQTLDSGKPGGRIGSALFPNGLTAVVSPQTAEQIAVAKQLVDRLMAQESATPLRATHEPVLRAAIDRMSHALETRDASVAAYETTLARQTATRDALVRSYDSIANTIRARFPKDRAQQDVFFDILRTSKTNDTIDPVVTPSGTNGAPTA